MREGERIRINLPRQATRFSSIPGHSETVYVDKDDITLRGVVEGGNRSTSMATIANDAILYSGNGFSVEWFKITH